MTQADLADTVGVSRQWLSALENGKPAIDLGLVLRVLDGLDLHLEVGPALPDTPSPTGVDLDELLDAYRDRS